MLTKNFSFLLLVLLPLALLAQKKTSFTGTVQAGFLAGAQGEAMQVSTAAGLRKDTWTAAVGTGLDYYYLRSIPVFLQLQKSFGNAKAPFVYAAGGYNIPWLRAVDKGWHIGEPKGGFYGDAGIGYQLPVLKNSALQFSVGYSVKNLTTTDTDLVIIAIYPPPPLVLYQEKHTLRRISIKTALWF
jgi:hypothetical protein